MENPIKMDDLGIPLFLEKPISGLNMLGFSVGCGGLAWRIILRTRFSAWLAHGDRFRPRWHRVVLFPFQLWPMLMAEIHGGYPNLTTEPGIILQEPLKGFRTIQLMVNWWFGSWDPRKWKGLLLKGTPIFHPKPPGSKPPIYHFLNYPKSHCTLKTGHFQVPTPAIQVLSPFHWRVQDPYRAFRNPSKGGFWNISPFRSSRMVETSTYLHTFLRQIYRVDSWIRKFHGFPPPKKNNCIACFLGDPYFCKPLCLKKNWLITNTPCIG